MVFFKESALDDIEQIFIEYDYACKQETVDWLNQLGISTKGLKVKTNTSTK